MASLISSAILSRGFIDQNNEFLANTWRDTVKRIILTGMDRDFARHPRELGEDWTGYDWQTRFRLLIGMSRTVNDQNGRDYTSLGKTKKETIRADQVILTISLEELRPRFEALSLRGPGQPPMTREEDERLEGMIADEIVNRLINFIKESYAASLQAAAEVRPEIRP